MSIRSHGANVTDTFSGAFTGEYAHRFIGFADSVSLEEAIDQLRSGGCAGVMVVHVFVTYVGLAAVIMALRNYRSDSYHPLSAEPTGQTAGIDLFHIPFGSYGLWENAKILFIQVKAY